MHLLQTEQFFTLPTDQWCAVLFNSVDLTVLNAKVVEKVVTNVINDSVVQFINWVSHLTAQMGQHYNTAFANLTAQVQTLQALHNTQAALIESYKRQISTILTLNNNTTSRLRKFEEPPAFQGANNKIKLEK